jgi:hypothetical protein
VTTGGKKRANPGRREREARRKRMNLTMGDVKFQINYINKNGKNHVLSSGLVRSIGTQTEHTGPVVQNNWVQESVTELPVLMHKLTM